MMIEGIGAVPIPGGPPTGSDATETPEYAEIVREVSRISLDGVCAVDWQSVVENAERVVRDRSKNLRVASYLAYGLYETHGLKGLCSGLDVVADMCGAFWSGLHPPVRRLRGRVLALEWLVERVIAALERGSPQETDASDCAAALTRAERLSATLSERSAAAGDAVSRLVRVLRDRNEAIGRAADRRRRQDEGGVSEAAPASSSEVSATSAIGVAAGRARETSKAREQSLRELRRAMLDAAHDLRTADIADVRAYALQRASIWLPVRELPPSTEGRTELPPPGPEVRGAIESAIAGGDHAGALAMCEDAASDNLFWLDAHRVAAESLMSMGHETAARTVRTQTGALLGRLPGLGDLRFKDGTPFAEPVTRRWLGLTAHGTGERDASGSTGAGA